MGTVTSGVHTAPPAPQAAVGLQTFVFLSGRGVMRLIVKCVFI